MGIPQQERCKCFGLMLEFALRPGLSRSSGCIQLHPPLHEWRNCRDPRRTTKNCFQTIGEHGCLSHALADCDTWVH
jgi:hypothetical protein